MAHFLCLLMWHRIHTPVVLSGTFWQVTLLSLDAPEFRGNGSKDQHKLFLKLPSAPTPGENLPREIPTQQIFPSQPATPTLSGLRSLHSQMLLNQWHPLFFHLSQNEMVHQCEYRYVHTCERLSNYINHPFL